jgi:hypothetical protein
MDFTLLHEHPWATVGVIAGGGLLLFIVFHRGSSGGTVASGPTYSGADPATVASANALQAQQDQISGSVQGLTIQGQTQIALAQISAGSQNKNVDASQDVTNRQTAAQLQLGLGTLGAQVAITQIQADAQMSLISRLIGAFSGPGVTGGGTVAQNPGGYSGTPVFNAPGNPVITANPIVQGPVAVADYPLTSGGFPTRDSYGLDPMGGGFHCSPYDAGCVGNQNTATNAYDLSIANWQATNNAKEEIANYQISVDAGVITPSQLAAMKTLQSQVH